MSLSLTVAVAGGRVAVQVVLKAANGVAEGGAKGGDEVANGLLTTRTRDRGGGGEDGRAEEDEDGRDTHFD